jgi:FlaA1/EpsC-like NDP-sugar epimerase
VLAAFGLRKRTSILAGLALANFSEFGLIVTATGVDAGLVERDWLVVVSVAVAASFVISTLVNHRGTRLVARLSSLVPTLRDERTHPEDAPLDIGHARVLVLGVGRVGRAVRDRLTEEYGLTVVGVENDPVKVTRLREQDVHVIEADATDDDFWDRCVNDEKVDIIVLAMPFHGSNLIALEQVDARDFEVTVAVVAQYDDERDELIARGADVAFHIFEGTGVGLADSAAEAAGVRE